VMGKLDIVDNRWSGGVEEFEGFCRRADMGEISRTD
jgi:hypothetical protein